MVRALVSTCASVAVFACLAALACGSVPEPRFVPDCELDASCGSDGAVFDDGGDARLDDAAGDGGPPACFPTLDIVCCGAIPCFSASSKKRCVDECDACAACTNGAKCCVGVQPGDVHCSTTGSCP